MEKGRHSLQRSGKSSYVGKRLAETDWREQGVMMIGIRRANGERVMPPPADTIIHGGDSLFACGSAASVNARIGDAEAVD
ncbi:MAG: TrkA C-terminal domain-containing protein [Planctomycetes bacterium]|nr:TrkA C-terminal domain-containing protein [Planctomycetota bacterium]